MKIKFTSLTRFVLFSFVSTACLILAPPLSCQMVPTIKHVQPLEAAYQAVLNELKKEDFAVESASADAGLKTALVVAGRYHQTGTHIEMQFVKDGDSATTIRVSVLEQTRYRALKTEPWSDPKVNQEASEALVARLKEGLGWKE